MPNAVDITEVPGYSGVGPSGRSFIRPRIIYFNTAFAAMLNQARASLPGLTIYAPDFFTLLDNMVTNAASYGFINVTSDALDSNLDDLEGTGTNYLFWDYQDPSAMAHEIMADVALQLISPASISSLTMLNGSNQLTVANLPLGLSGFVDGTTNLASGSWTSLTNFDSASATQTIFVPVPVPAVPAVPNDGPPLPGGGGTGTNSAVYGPLQFYRLRFPFAWSWP
jgi:phospholipase/lecithinase/hemolysin